MPTLRCFQNCYRTRRGFHFRRLQVTLSAANLGARVGGDHEKARPGGICLCINGREDQGTWRLAREDGRPPRMNVKNRRSSAVTVPAISPASAIIHQKLWQKLWQKLRVEELRGGGEREPRGTWLLPGRESTGLQKGNRYGHFEGRTAQAGCVRNDGNECAVLVSKSPADYQGGTSFPRHAEIDQPDLTAARGGRPLPQGTRTGRRRQRRFPRLPRVRNRKAGNGAAPLP